MSGKVHHAISPQVKNTLSYQNRAYCNVQKGPPCFYKDFIYCKA